MATISIDTVTADFNITSTDPARWGRGDFILNDLSKIIVATGRQYIYRGLVGGDYVYSTGSPPVGASDIVIVGRTAG